jgi:hypothetical protein
MKKPLLLLLALGLLASACRKPDSGTSTEPNSALFQRFHGKYRPISSVSSEAVDVNRDGRESVDLLSEIEELPSAHLEIRLYSSGYLFVQFWPEQFVRGFERLGEPAQYDPKLSVNYARQGAVYMCRVNAAVTQIDVIPELNPGPNRERYAPPLSVRIRPDDSLEVTNEKKFYTPTGWKTVRIVSIYKRFTMTT